MTSQNNTPRSRRTLAAPITGAIAYEVVTIFMLRTGMAYYSSLGVPVSLPSVLLIHVLGLDTYPSEDIVRKGIPVDVVALILNPLIAAVLIILLRQLSNCIKRAFRGR